MEHAIFHIEEMIKEQTEKLVETAKRIVPYATFEDVLQPQDFPKLDQDPAFRYEEGVLYGLEKALAALRATLRENG